MIDIAQGSSLLHADKQYGNEIANDQIQQLRKQGFTNGLAKALTENAITFPLRIWVVDNSGSMSSCDGHSINLKPNKVEMTSCSRWEEIRQCVNYHAEMSGILVAPTSFRLLNKPSPYDSNKSQFFSVAEMGESQISHELQTARSIMDSRPGGLTPLTRHILEIQEIVRAMTPQLAKEGKKVVIVLATDGLPTDENGKSTYERTRFVQALRQLEGLPVWVVIRLCTDEDDVVSFYNNLDDQLELSLEVLDDFVAEAREVYQHNRWINYALPLHRCREMGFYDRVFDLIDERTLTKSEVRQFCVLLFGEEKWDGVPDPNVDWLGFVSELEGMLGEEGYQWDPIRKGMMPWINTKELHRVYGPNSCGECCIM